MLRKPNKKNSHDKFPKLKRWHFETSFVPIKLIIGPEEEAIKYRNWFFGKNIKFPEKGDGNSDGRTFFVPGHTILIWLPYRPKNMENLGTLVHELIHVIEKIGLQCDIRLCKETSEFFGYLMDDLFVRMCGAMRIKIR